MISKKEIRISSDSKPEDFLESVKEILENLGVKYKESGEEVITISYEFEDNNIMKVYDQLGFPIDLNVIYERLTNDCNDEEFYEELYSFGDIKFTSVDLPPNKKKYNKWIKLNYEVYSEMYNATFDGFSIKIDNKGRVFSSMSECPWKGSGIDDEIENIIMKYISEIKYNNSK